MVSWLFIHFFISMRGSIRIGLVKGIGIEYTIDDCLSIMLASYKCSFSTRLPVYILGLPCRKPHIVWKVIDNQG